MDSSNPKKNNPSPGIVKKSLESYKKKIANYSPTNTHKTK